MQWALNATTGLVDVTSYKYFIFVDSSVRGPFLPAYWPVRLSLRTQSLMAFMYCTEGLIFYSFAFSLSMYSSPPWHMNVY